jgi:hypothetical protein
MSRYVTFGMAGLRAVGRFSPGRVRGFGSRGVVWVGRHGRGGFG